VSNKVLSCRLWRSSLQHRTSPDIDSGIKISIHKLHPFLAIIRCTHQCKKSSHFCPPFHLLLRQRSVLCYFLRTPLALLHLDPLKCTSQLMVSIRRSELMYRYCDKTSCAFLVRSLRVAVNRKRNSPRQTKKVVLWLSARHGGCFCRVHGSAGVSRSARTPQKPRVRAAALASGCWRLHSTDTS